jgi:hypothetical protein
MKVAIDFNMRFREVIYILVALVLFFILTRSVWASLGILGVLGFFVALWGGLPPKKER